MSRWRSLLMAALLTLLLSGCAFLQPVTIEKAMENGNYIQATQLLVSRFQQQASNLNSSQSAYIVEKVSQLSQIAEQKIHQSTADSYPSQIEGHQILLSIRTEIADQPHGNILEQFIQTYPADQLRQKLAELYYRYADSYPGSNSHSYKRKAELYQAGMTYNPQYKDIAKRYQTSQNKYYQTAAQEYYAEGQQYAREQDYQAAAERFTQAYQVYQPLGKYKDSQALAARYDRQYRTQAAENYVAQARALANSNSSKATKRQISYYYRQAADIYQPYGDYHNAAALASQYWHQGIVRVYVRNHKLEDLIHQHLDSQFIEYVYTSATADIVIDLHIRPEQPYRQQRGEEQTDQRTNKVRIGTDKKKLDSGIIIPIPQYQEYQYTVHSRTDRNHLSLRGELSVHGLYTHHKRYYGEASSEESHYWYSGNLPPNNSSGQQKGHLASEAQLYQQAYEDIISKLTQDLDQLNSQIADL